ncbi:type VII secretion system-associated protein [Nocardia jinanensis]|uniref:Type VII secretion system-associated protein n=1 Tax=Nocardia jinanensis TaxID=382504 RepID=A0A917VZ60_9NOCA|nr:type VII secretion system-associated protein [Nocardia jinanensis]GGL42331.1 hypothetical protein GCM10011588_66350 [Nocardia jinanensis]
MKEPVPGAVRRDDWFVLLDPAWQPESSEAPPHVMVGGWKIEHDDRLGPFQPNPQYVPSASDVPTDPIDSLLRSFAAGRTLDEQFIGMFRNTVVHIGCDEQNSPVTVESPDGVNCVMVVTAEVHKRRRHADRWWPVVGSALPEIVPAGADILVNPSGPAQFRLRTSALLT